MKRNTPKKLRYMMIRRRQLKRKLFTKRVVKSIPSAYPRKVVTMPTIVDLYRSKNHRLLMIALNRLRKGAPKNGVVLDFSHTVLITASGGILIRAEVDRLVTRLGKAAIRLRLPQIIAGKSNQRSKIATAVLQKIGLISMLGYPDQPTEHYTNVDCWEAEQGETADGSLVDALLDKIDSVITVETRRRLYRGAVEALANVCEHAYPHRREDGLAIKDTRWWMFSAIMEERLVILVCDLGVGIPKTVQKTQPPSLLGKIFATFGYNATNDSKWIKTATLVKRTRTMEGYRGHGGTDLRAIVESEAGAFLSIFSNKGYFKLSQTTETLRERPDSIMGTIVEWSIKVDI
jgi:hypothetical protein